MVEREEDCLSSMQAAVTRIVTALCTQLQYAVASEKRD